MSKVNYEYYTNVSYSLLLLFFFFFSLFFPFFCVFFFFWYNSVSTLSRGLDRAPVQNEVGGGNQWFYLWPFTTDWIMRFSTARVNGTACLLFNLVTENSGMLVVFLQTEPEECFEGMLI